MFPGMCFRRGPALLFLLVLLGTGFIGMVHPTLGELDWTQRSVDLRADAKSTVLEARFPFTNKGNTAVEVTQVESSCGCTVVSLEKRRYAPKEQGEIVARYTVGTAVGDQKKTVEVVTSDSPEPVILTLDIHIPEILRIRPAFVSWDHGEPLTAKTIILETRQDTPFKDLSVQSSAVAFGTEVKPLVPGRKYEVRIVPKSTDQRQFSTLTIQGRFGNEERVFRAYASVRPPEPKD